MKVSGSKTSDESGTGREVKLQGVEVVKIDEFKYLGSAMQSNR